MLEVSLVERILDIFYDGFRRAPMLAIGMLVLCSWFVIKNYNKNKIKLFAAIKRLKM